MSLLHALILLACAVFLYLAVIALGGVQLLAIGAALLLIVLVVAGGAGRGRFL